MNEDLTKKLPSSDSEKLTLILTTVQSLSTRVDSIDSRLQGVEQRVLRVEQTADDASPVLPFLVTNVTHLQEGQRRLEGRFEERFGQLEKRFGHVEQGYGQLEKRFGHLEQGYGQLEERFGHLEQGYGQLEKRFGHLEQGYGQLEKRFGHLEQGYGQLEERFGHLEEGLESVRSEVVALRHSVNHRFTTLSGAVNAACRDLDGRVTRLEANSSPPNSQT